MPLVMQLILTTRNALTRREPQQVSEELGLQSTACTCCHHHRRKHTSNCLCQTLGCQQYQSVHWLHGKCKLHRLHRHQCS